jgi:hypothetical protein
MRRRVRIGRRFDLEVSVQDKVVGRDVRHADVAITGDLGEAIDADTRSRLAYVAFSLVAGFLVVAAVLGVYRGDFGALQRTWDIAAPILGGVVGYYFTPVRAKV